MLDDPIFEGELAGYATVDSPRYLGRGALNAVCLAFRNVTMFQLVDDACEGLVYVPAFPTPTVDRLPA